jgi:hypothetical protein
MRYYLSALPVPAGAVLVVGGHCRGDILAVCIDQMLVHSSKETCYCDNLVLNGFIGHRVEQ